VLPLIYKDEGAFDRRAYLSLQDIDRLATLQVPELLERVAAGRATPAMRLARWRRSLRAEADRLFASSPPTTAVLRAMLLGDQSFVDRNESEDFQKTGVFQMQSRFGSRLATVSCGLLALSALAVATHPISPQRTAGQLEVNVVDVGQGDSIFEVSPVGGTILIDGGGAFQGFAGHEEHLGPDPGEDGVAPYLWSRGFKKLDVIALTHAQQDHVGGSPAILENFQVGRLWVSQEVGAPARARLEEAARRNNIPIDYEGRGKSFVWGGVAGTLLWPENPEHDTATTAKNNDSLVMRLQYFQSSILLPGAAEKQAEYSMLDETSAAELSANILKIGHHGSKNSTTLGFLAAVQPRIAIISAEFDNSYGHPSPELPERLEQASVRILRSDRDGAVHVLADGKQTAVSCYVACAEPGSAANSEPTQFPNQQ
jgi:beta-lactamase superfamily II metal-dependent hydrolase